jgi:hypothetical protein
MSYFLTFLDRCLDVSDCFFGLVRKIIDSPTLFRDQVGLRSKKI